MPSHLASVLTLQRLAGNAATTEALSVQRLSGRGRRRESDDYDPDLAYGSDHGSPSPAETSFRGSVGSVHFSAESNGGLMREIFDFVADAAPHFSRELSAAGSITVRLGRTQGGTPGEWRASSRTITLDPRRASPGHLAGTAVFEILNAAADRRLTALEAEVRSGRLDSQAAREGWPPDQFFAMEVERIEWENGMRHRQIVAGAGRSGTSADLFASEGDFNTYYERQVRAGHTHSYEFRYGLLRAEAASDAARRRDEQSTSSSHGSDRRRHRSHR